MIMEKMPKKVTNYNGKWISSLMLKHSQCLLETMCQEKHVAYICYCRTGRRALFDPHNPWIKSTFNNGKHLGTSAPPGRRNLLGTIVSLSVFPSFLLTYIFPVHHLRPNPNSNFLKSLPNNPNPYTLFSPQKLYDIYSVCHLS